MSLLVDEWSKRCRRGLHQDAGDLVTSFSECSIDYTQTVQPLLREFPTQTYGLVMSLLEANNGDYLVTREILTNLIQSSSSRLETLQSAHRKRRFDDLTDDNILAEITSSTSSQEAQRKMDRLIQNMKQPNPENIDPRILTLLRHTVIKQASKMQNLKEQLSDMKRKCDRSKEENDKLTEANLLLTLYIKHKDGEKFAIGPQNSYKISRTYPEWGTM